MSDAETERKLTPTASERRVRTAILVGAVALLAGIALALSEDDLGRWLTVGGLLVLFVTLHRFGRLGADPS